MSRRRIRKSLRRLLRAAVLGRSHEATRQRRLLALLEGDSETVTSPRGIEHLEAQLAEIPLGKHTDGLLLPDQP